MRCGWRSSSFGSRFNIDHKLLKVAQGDLGQHYKDKHPGEPYKIEVVFNAKKQRS